MRPGPPGADSASGPTASLIFSGVYNNGPGRGGTTVWSVMPKDRPLIPGRHRAISLSIRPIGKLPMQPWAQGRGRQARRRGPRARDTTIPTAHCFPRRVCPARVSTSRRPDSDHAGARNTVIFFCSNAMVVGRTVPLDGPCAHPRTRSGLLGKGDFGGQVGGRDTLVHRHRPNLNGKTWLKPGGRDGQSCPSGSSERLTGPIDGDTIKYEANGLPIQLVYTRPVHDLISAAAGRTDETCWKGGPVP